ncbi:uncharacterized protein LOC122016893 isoform X2 [Zingiber officinale]|uniref:uncharacterized protein LOC122016893 isoform X2 n=1 Tax=Zingiber officinale TaxID=94328 RepID=UPI001C4B449B|nr:uncharacterized protein LOC122016893 isoform X2 [Zingiber officinale]
MALPTLDRGLLFLVAILAPLRIFNLCSRLLRGGIVRGRLRAARSVVLVISVVVLLASIFSLSDTYPSERSAVIAEMEDLRLKTARLEFILEDSTKALSSTTFHLEQRDKLLEEMEKKVRLMENAIYEVKGSSSDSLDTEDRVRALEKEIQLLFEQSMMNTDSIRSLESHADEAKEKMETAASEVQKMTTKKVLKRNRQKEEHKNQIPFKETVSKAFQFIRSTGHHASEVILADSFFLRASFSKSAIPEAYKQLKVFMSLVKKCHHELQDSIRHDLKMNEFTADLGNDFVVFYLASMMMVISVVTTWIVSSWCFSLLTRRLTRSD